VRLKEFTIKNLKNGRNISIPSGAIKRKCGKCIECRKQIFQFLLVRLKEDGGKKRKKV